MTHELKRIYGAKNLTDKDTIQVGDFYLDSNGHRIPLKRCFGGTPQDCDFRPIDPGEGWEIVPEGELESCVPEHKTYEYTRDGNTWGELWNRSKRSLKYWRGSDNILAFRRRKAPVIGQDLELPKDVQELLSNTPVVTEADKVRLAKAVIELSKEPSSDPLSGWIGVEERVPDNNEDVQVFVPIKRHYKRDYRCGYRECNGRWYVYRAASEAEEMAVTHWRPLADNPVVVKGVVRAFNEFLARKNGELVNIDREKVKMIFFSAWDAGKNDKETP